MQVLFTLLFKFIVSIANFFLIPVNAIINNVFPDFSNMISTFNYILNRYLGNGISWFFHILPPRTQVFVLLYVDCLVIFYVVSLAIHGVIKVIEIIKNIKIW